MMKLAKKCPKINSVKLYHLRQWAPFPKVSLEEAEMK